MDWKVNEGLIKAFNELHLSIDHARFGEMRPYEGTHTLPTNRLYFNIDDTGDIFWGKSRAALRAGTIAFIPYNLPLSCRFKGGRMVAFHYNLEIFPEADLLVDLEECFFFDAPEICMKMYETMIHFKNLSDVLAIQLEIISLSSRFLDKDLNYFNQQARLRKKHEGLLKLITENLDAHLNVERLAFMMGMNRNTLSKAFKRDLGIPLKTYLTQKLVRKASMLLMESGTVKEVAKDLNFNDEFYFSRFFKKHTGMSPSVFRDLRGEMKVSIP